VNDRLQVFGFESLVRRWVKILS